jgi:hypothetical protein
MCRAELYERIKKYRKSRWVNLNFIFAGLRNNHSHLRLIPLHDIIWDIVNYNDLCFGAGDRWPAALSCVAYHQRAQAHCSRHFRRSASVRSERKNLPGSLEVGARLIERRGGAVRARRIVDAPDNAALGVFRIADRTGLTIILWVRPISVTVGLPSSAGVSLDMGLQG